MKLKYSLGPLLKKVEDHWFSTFVFIYVVHIVFIKQIIHGLLPSLRVVYQPLKLLPTYLFSGVEGFHGWDSGHYKSMFASLYENVSPAWPPLYPLLLRMVNVTFHFEGDAFNKSAVFVNFFCHFFTVWGIFYFLRQDRRVEVRPLAQHFPIWLVPSLLLFFPGHNVYFAAYSESLFLTLTVLVFILRSRQLIFLAALVAGLSCLVRTMGIFLVVALSFEQIFFMLKDRRLNAKNILKSSVGVLFFIAWCAYAQCVKGISIFAAQEPWIDEMTRMHVPAGENTHWWALKYLILPRHKECIFFYLTCGTVIYCWFKKRYLEFFYVGFYLLSLFIHPYRPFPFTRHISVLFPFMVFLVDTIKSLRQLRYGALLVSIIISFNYMMRLFLDKIGEP